MSLLFQQYNISPWLSSVRLCDSSNLAGTYFNGQTNNGVGATLTIAASSLTIDSVVANVSDRILLTAQTSANQNGIYVVASIGSVVVLQRSADQQSIEQFHEGQYVSVGAGTALGGSAFVLVEPLPAQLGISNMSWVDASSSANIALPTIANHIATYTNTAGALGENAATAINGGNIQAGLSGTAGTLASFPATATKGSLVIAGVANTGNTNTTISNDAMGQASVVNIPDPANAIGQFLVGATATPFVSGNFPENSGTAGLMIDSGISITSIASVIAAGPLSAQVTMTAAQFNGMYAAPLLLVAAPGANSMIIVDSIAIVMTYGSAAFAAGGVVAAQYDSTADGAGVIASTTEAAADFFATASTVFKLNPGAVLAPFSTCANKGLYLSNVTQAFTTGTGSAFIVKVRYHIVSTTA
jgi:hypothetical protein